MWPGWDSDQGLLALKAFAPSISSKNPSNIMFYSVEALILNVTCLSLQKVL